MRVNQDRLLLAMANACVCNRKLCEKSGVAQPTLSRIKSGKAHPKPVTVGRLAHALGIPVEQLVEETL